MYIFIVRIIIVILRVFLGIYVFVVFDRVYFWCFWYGGFLEKDVLRLVFKIFEEVKIIGMMWSEVLVKLKLK